MNDVARDPAGLVEELVAIRHDLHQHPELGFEEHRTQARVRQWLERWGYAPHAIAETGLVADVCPDRPGPIIALRADLDCLPMDETTPLPYRSVHAGRAHKCGHDGHTTILMGVAALLAQRRTTLPGNVRLLFQPAEEGVRGGGAKVMVEAGCLADVAEVYALHNWPDFPKGEIRVRAGAVMAQIYGLHIDVRGRGGHGSQPHRCRDPIVAASQLVCALQTVVSRSLGYEEGAVVSVCSFRSGNTTNVIPETAHLQGTIRTFDDGVTQTVLERIEGIAAGIASAFDVAIDVRLERGYPLLVNHPACAAAVRDVAAAQLGAGAVSERGLPLAAGEDFAYMTQTTPGAYFFVGTGDREGTTPGCHHPDFDFCDDVIPLAMRLLVGLVDRRLDTLADQA